ncbi:MAG TPA: hypothetical protein VJT09_17415 [Pyrinomonadaceae bacterium]|nr:hypothetical protein [Pyrinomonadaceae bacterium]
MSRLFKHALPLAIVLAALMFGNAGTSRAQSRGTEIIRPIKFERGKRTATLTGSVQLPHGEGDMHNDGADRYELKYRAGQRVTFTLESEGNRAVFSISTYGPNGPNLPAQKTRWTGRLPASGDYLITVWTSEGAAKYTLHVSLR